MFLYQHGYNIKNHIFWVLPQHKPTNKGRKFLLPHHNKQTKKSEILFLPQDPSKST